MCKASDTTHSHTNGVYVNYYKTTTSSCLTSLIFQVTSVWAGSLARSSLAITRQTEWYRRCATNSFKALKRNQSRQPNVHCVPNPQNDTALACYNFDTLQMILTIFGRNIAERAGYRNTHPFNGPLSGTTQVSRHQKGKTNLDFTEARDSE